jgi:hypothetical protein
MKEINLTMSKELMLVLEELNSYETKINMTTKVVSEAIAAAKGADNGIRRTRLAIWRRKVEQIWIAWSTTGIVGNNL